MQDLQPAQVVRGTAGKVKIKTWSVITEVVTALETSSYITTDMNRSRKINEESSAPHGLLREREPNTIVTAV